MIGLSSRSELVSINHPRMSDWQKTVHQSVDTLDKLRAYVALRFGEEVAEREIDVEALAPAFENFQMRITPAALDLIQEPGDPIWRRTPA